MSIDVHEDSGGSRYVALEDGREVGLLTFARRRDVFELIHTVTDPDERGHGVASALVGRAFDDARERGERVRIICPFVESWLQRHPEQADIVTYD